MHAIVEQLDRHPALTGSGGTMATVASWLISLQASTEVLQFIAALAAAVGGVLTVVLQIRSWRTGPKSKAE